MRFHTYIPLMSFLLLLSVSSFSFAESETEKLETIRTAALDIRNIQKQQGNLRALADIDECYGRSLRPSKIYGKEVETCLAKDFVIASISAAFYSQLSPEGRKANNVDPKRTLDEMRRRLGATFIFFGIPGDEAAAFGKLLVTNALQFIQTQEGEK